MTSLSVMYTPIIAISFVEAVKKGTESTTHQKAASCTAVRFLEMVYSAIGDNVAESADESSFTMIDGYQMTTLEVG
ncbi:hypothetical protein HOY82DRAFT_609449 [Tuber indicum]|nr:hypothetical protein HOY82DRAFT_609449 [Tuber indicum]